MSNVFAVPCPGCGQSMSVWPDGHLECRACRQAYEVHMGLLVALDDRVPDETAAPVGRALAESV